jgi:hypothetical protein
LFYLGPRLSPRDNCACEVELLDVYEDSQVRCVGPQHFKSRGCVGPGSRGKAAAPRVVPPFGFDADREPDAYTTGERPPSTLIAQPVT